MDPSTIYWFVCIASLSSLAWAGGYYLGKQSAALARTTLYIGLSLMLAWCWLHYHPAVAVKLIPLPVLTRLEGVGGVPIFMLLLGLAWSRAKLPRQKRAIRWAIVLGWLFFLNGGLWMLQSTPHQSFAGTVAGETVLQSQEYSCVPAACTQALNILGVLSTEQQMAELTQTRPGTGSTMLRAMQGLQERLSNSDYTVELVETDVEGLRDMPFPVLTPVRYEPAQLHMVTLTRANDHTVHYIDPVDGSMSMSYSTFETVYGGRVLVFVRH